VTEPLDHKLLKWMAMCLPVVAAAAGLVALLKRAPRAELLRVLELRQRQLLVRALERWAERIGGPLAIVLRTAAAAERRRRGFAEEPSP
jgi:hypothetical protein